MKKGLVLVVAALMAMVCFAQAQKAEVRTWTRKDGSVACEGTFVKVYTNEKTGTVCVQIKKSTGGEMGPVLSLLSEADQAYVKQMATEPAAAE